MANGITVAHRMKEARLQTALRRHETLSQARMAELVAAEMGAPLHQAQWSNYESGKSEPPLAVIRAAAKLSGLALSYVAFPEEKDESPLLDLDPAKDRRLTEEETARAIRRAAAEKPPRPRTQTRANGRRSPKKDQ